MSAAKKRTGRRILFLLLVLLLIIMLIIGIFIWKKQKSEPEGPITPPTSPRATAQPADCVDVQTIVIPGTWESSAKDSASQPVSHPRSLMLTVSKSLQQKFAEKRNAVHTVPYVAQFSNPVAIPPDGQVSYKTSRDQGTARAKWKMSAVYKRCPLTGFVLLGFSQGAVIAGDIASAIGNGRSDIPASNILGVGLIADGRRTPGYAPTMGPNPSGSGAEVALAPIGKLIPGIDLRGSRSGGFGTIREKVLSLCAPNDLICDSPTIAGGIGDLIGSGTKIASAITNPVHGAYARTKYWSLGGVAAPDYLAQWSANVIRNAPYPPHK